MKGFTLVELLVSIGIFTLITAVAIFNNSQFNGSVLLTNLAYEIALSIRQAQTYGVSVRQNSSQSFNSGYGVHFASASPTSYLLFEDKPGGTSYVYNSGSDPIVQTFTISKGNKISKICLNGTIPCTNNSIVDIAFTRPYPDAYIMADGVSGSGYAKAEVCVKSPQGTIRKITVESTGQISVGSDATGICN